MRLAIDPGHGLSNRRDGKYDPGFVAAGVQEADVALAWALTLNWVLRNAGVDTYLTRSDDRTHAPVGKRDDMAELAKCTHFLSLHCNAGPPTATGTETFFRDNADAAFASKVQSAALVALGLRNRGIRSERESQHQRLAIFDFDGPCALLEIGFLSHPNDRKKMLDRNVRLAFAREMEGIL